MNRALSVSALDVARELQRTVAFFGAALMLSVWPLWSASPQEVVQIPWFSMLCGASQYWDLAALIAVVCGLVQLGWGSRAAREQRIGLACLTAGLLVLVAFDQHRLQPWVMQILLFGGLFLLAPNSAGLEYWKIIVASIYLWSALSKCDVAFLDSHGQVLLQGMLHPLGISIEHWSQQTRQILAALLPLGELVIGLLLLMRRTRRFGLPASIAMHVLLIWTLGWGLRHEWSVLIWNVYFIVQNCLLFGADCWSPVPRGASMRRASAAFWYTALAATYPVLECWGWCDHWPAWAVYSSRPAQVRVLIGDDSAGLLPAADQNWLRAAAPLDDRRPFSLDAWSFAVCRCPVYPQLRYRLALALALLENKVPESSVTVEIALTPDRWTGKRQHESLSGLEAVRRRCAEFWLNTRRR